MSSGAGDGWVWYAGAAICILAVIVTTSLRIRELRQLMAHAPADARRVHRRRLQQQLGVLGGVLAAILAIAATQSVKPYYPYTQIDVAAWLVLISSGMAATGVAIRLRDAPEAPRDAWFVAAAAGAGGWLVAAGLLVLISLAELSMIGLVVALGSGLWIVLPGALLVGLITQIRRPSLGPKENV